MCCGVRWTDRRTAASSLIFTRPRKARRKRMSRLSSFMRLLLLRFFERNLFVGIFDTLALVRFGRPEAAYLRSGLTDALPIDAFDNDFGLRRGLDRDAFRNREIDQVGITTGQAQGLALPRGAIP